MDINEAGDLLYWCERSKRAKDRRVEFDNSDPRIVRVFMKYLRTKGIHEKRLRLRMELHTGDDEEECRDYWKEVTGTRNSSFIATSVRATSILRKHLPYGTITIRYNSFALFQRIMYDISMLADALSQD